MFVGSVPRNTAAKVSNLDPAVVGGGRGSLHNGKDFVVVLQPQGPNRFVIIHYTSRLKFEANGVERHVLAGSVGFKNPVDAGRLSHSKIQFLPRLILQNNIEGIARQAFFSGGRAVFLHDRAVDEADRNKAMQW